MADGAGIKKPRKKNIPRVAVDRSRVAGLLAEGGPGGAGAQIFRVCEVHIHDGLSSFVSAGCGGGSKSGGADGGPFLQSAPPCLDRGREPGEASFPGVSNYYFWCFKLFCLCGLRRGVEIGWRIWRVLWKRCATTLFAGGGTRLAGAHEGIAHWFLPIFSASGQNRTSRS